MKTKTVNRSPKALDGKGMLKLVKTELGAIRKTLSPQSPRQDIEMALTVIAALRVKSRVWDMLYGVSGIPVSQDKIAELSTLLSCAEDLQLGDCAIYAEAAEVIELLDWGLDMLTWHGTPTDHLYAWDDLVTVSLRIWHLWQRSADALGREPHPDEMDAIREKMADTDARFADVIRSFQSAA